MVRSSNRSRYQIKLGFRGKGFENLNRAKRGMRVTTRKFEVGLWLAGKICKVKLASALN